MPVTAGDTSRPYSADQCCSVNPFASLTLALNKCWNQRLWRASKTNAAVPSHGPQPDFPPVYVTQRARYLLYFNVNPSPPKKHVCLLMFKKKERISQSGCFLTVWKKVPHLPPCWECAFYWRSDCFMCFVSVCGHFFIVGVPFYFYIAFFFFFFF